MYVCLCVCLFPSSFETTPSCKVKFLGAIFPLLVPSFDHRGRFNSRQLAKPSIIIHQWFCPGETFLSATKINCHVNCGQFSKSPAVNVSAGKEFLTPEAIFASPQGTTLGRVGVLKFLNLFA